MNGFWTRGAAEMTHNHYHLKSIWGNVFENRQNNISINLESFCRDKSKANDLFCFSPTPVGVSVS